MENPRNSFAEKQAQVLSFIQQTKSLLESLHRCHVSEKYLLIYPRGGGSPSVDGRNSRGQSITRASKANELRIIGFPDDIRSHQDDMDDASTARIFGSRIFDCLSYLEKLRSRVSDKASRILVTGDVNSGKSTFVNALLRKELLPSDQQPCTQAFCEVVTCLNGDTENSVHAMTDYDRYDASIPSTFDKMTIENMQDFIQDEDTRYQLFKVFLSEKNEKESSFVHSTAMDISLIDSPGLNSDLFKTMSLFSKQEDIDVIVFLINAANHLTLSAREFLENASQEKAYIFIVVNKFDEIKNQDKCRRMVLAQIQEVLPKTFEDQGELIHFVSTGRFLKDFCQLKEANSASSIVRAPIAENLDDTNTKFYSSFLHLETQLQKFILEKRTKSKLLPAQTYLGHLLAEVLYVLDFNMKRRKEELSKIAHELEIISPCYDELMAHHGLIQADLRRSTDEACHNLYNNAVTLLSSVKIEEEVSKTKWKGLFGTLKFKREFHVNVVLSLKECIKKVKIQCSSHVNSGLHILHATATSHTKQIFSTFPQVPSEQELLGMLPHEEELFTEPSEMASLEMLDFSTFFRKSTWLSAATLASATFGYQPMLSLALRIFDLSRRGGKIVATTIVLVSGGVALMLLLSDLESVIRGRLLRHYSQFVSSSEWLHIPSKKLESSARNILNEEQNNLVARFEMALHNQRQLRAEKDLLRCQTETTLTYLDDQLRGTQSLLSALRQYEL